VPQQAVTTAIAVARLGDHSIVTDRAFSAL
jgi:hypothetical protein